LHHLKFQLKLLCSFKPKQVKLSIQAKAFGLTISALSYVVSNNHANFNFIEIKIWNLPKTCIKTAVIAWYLISELIMPDFIVI
jgi:hypothetical protein